MLHHGEPITGGCSRDTAAAAFLIILLCISRHGVRGISMKETLNKSMRWIQKSDERSLILCFGSQRTVISRHKADCGKMSQDLVVMATVRSESTTTHNLLTGLRYSRVPSTIENVKSTDWAWTFSLPLDRTQILQAQWNSKTSQPLMPCFGSWHTTIDSNPNSTLKQ